MTRLPPHFIDLVYDALLKSFWAKKDLKNFLRRSHIAESFLAQFDSEATKREWLDLLFPKLEMSDRGQALIQQMARSLTEQRSFPGLENWEDSAEKLSAAKASVAKLKEYLDEKMQERLDEQEASRLRTMGEESRLRQVRSQKDLLSLGEALNSLVAEIGTQEGGLKFQDWFYDVMDYSDVDNRRPYTVSGRQIDGSITIDGTTYLVELKFTKNQTDVTEIDSLLKKVTDKADNTMGILVSMSGYSSVAIAQASFSRSPLLLFDHSHLYLVLGNVSAFPNVVRRVRRHSSQEGRAFLPVNEFGGR